MTISNFNVNQCQIVFNMKESTPRCEDVADKLVRLFGWRQTYPVQKLQRSILPQTPEKVRNIRKSQAPGPAHTTVPIGTVQVEREETIVSSLFSTIKYSFRLSERQTKGFKATFFNVNFVPTYKLMLIYCGKFEFT